MAAGAIKCFGRETGGWYYRAIGLVKCQPPILDGVLTPYRYERFISAARWEFRPVYFISTRQQLSNLHHVAHQ